MEKIKLTNVSFAYEKNAAPVLCDINISIDEGETLCVAGANGCGKSTLLQIIAGIIKPSSGSITRAKNTGIVFQEVDHQLFMPTVWEDVAFGLLKKDIPAEAAREQALAALRSVGAEHLAHKPPYKLSGGEKQRAALAGILVTCPEVLVLDEPTAALDPRARKNLIALLHKLPRTKIIASHDLDLILDLAEDGARAAFLNEGRVVSGSLTDEPFLQSIGLELPLSMSSRP